MSMPPELLHSSYASLETMARERKVKRAYWFMLAIAAVPLALFQLSLLLPSSVRTALIDSGLAVRLISPSRFIHPRIHARLIAADSETGPLTIAYLDWVGLLLALIVITGAAAVIFCAARYQYRWADRQGSMVGLLFVFPAVALTAIGVSTTMLHGVPWPDPIGVQIGATIVLFVVQIGLFGCAGSIWAAPYISKDGD